MEIKATNFYVNPINIKGNSFYLDETESYHLAKVMRAKPGDIFYAIDGVGNKFKASLESASPNKCLANILETTYNENEPHCKVTLACGLCRSAKVDFIVEKGTELGINKFCFFISDNTLADDIKQSNAVKKTARWQKLALSAAKQSLRTIVPVIMPPLVFNDMLKMTNENDLSLIADLKTPIQPLSELFSTNPKSLLLMIGPEAGFSENEIQLAIKNGFQTASLGPRRLRAETAAITFSVIAMSHLGEI